jgi:hypothetical protein
MHEWHDFFVAQVGATAALVGLLFVAVSINLEKILKFRHLPARGMEAILVLTCVLVISTCALVPGLHEGTYGVTMALTGFMTWALQLRALLYTRRSGYESVPRILMNQLPPLPFVVGGVLMATGHPDGIYWALPGTLLCIFSGIFSAWILLVEIQR